jgi:hypothetical protein
VNCGEGQTNCGGVCASTQTDRSHCGRCGAACQSGEVCLAGRCAVSCLGTQTNCAGRCVDTQTDVAHCGGCGVTCGAGRICVSGRCEVTCGVGQTACGTVCRDTRSDRAHCGMCDTACAAGQVCDDARCVLSCAAGQVDCGGRCVDTQSDRAHCGVCNRACAAGQVCAAGACALSCPTGQVACSGLCVDTRNDRAHCGMCGSACAAGQVCAASRCTVSCPTGQTDCAGRCLDLQGDDLNCGACNNRCGVGARCRSGVCAPTLQYRRPVTVLQSGGALGAYSVVLTVDTASLIAGGRMRSDCADLRFYSADLSATLPYFVEGPCNAPRTTVLVRLAMVPSGTSRFWMYYGGATFSADPSPADVFEFFDDFTSLASWDRFGSKPAVIQLATVDGRSVVRLGANLDNTTHWISSRASFTGDLEIRRMVRRVATDTYDCDEGEGWVTTRSNPPWEGSGARVLHVTGDGPIVSGGNGDIHGIWSSSSASVTRLAVGVEYLRPTWDTSVFRRCGTSVEGVFRGETLSATGAATSGTFLSLFVQDSSGADRGSLVDWVGVRRIACGEPTVTVGTEETAP